MEIKTEVKVYNIDMECPQCHKGKMCPTGVCFDSFPPIYPHKCTKCGYLENYDQIYPYTTYDEQYTEEAVKKHLRKTRQSEFLKMFPDAKTFSDGCLQIAPCCLHKKMVEKCNCKCVNCFREYWLNEIKMKVRTKHDSC